MKYSFLALIIVTVFSCKKKSDTTLNASVQGGEDALYSYISDTATMEMHTVLYDSIRTYQDPFKYLGSNQDPIFGRTNASIYTNVSLPNSSFNITFGDDAVIDSAEFILTFTQNYVGDTTNALRYQVYQLTELMDRNRLYCTYNTVAHTGLLSDAVRKITHTSGFYTIRLPLDKNYAAGIINNPQFLVDNTTFQNTYKGFYFTTQNTALNPGYQGALMKIDLDNPISGVYLYYHNGSSSSSRTPKSYRLSFSGDNSSRFNHVDYDYHSAANNLLVEQLDKSDTTKGRQNLFIKGLGGSKTVIRLPYIRNYASSCPIAVNRAELIFNVDQSFINTGSGTYDPPNQISMVACDANGREIYLKDQYYTTDVLRFGGSYDPVNKQYVFNISRHLQDIMSGKIDNHGFYLVVANTDRFSVPRRDDKAARAVLGGLANALYKPTFKLTYIRFPYDK